MGLKVLGFWAKWVWIEGWVLCFGFLAKANELRVFGIVVRRPKLKTTHKS